jgi:lipoprotein-anchoring transpeptidase ErfK/SrfK
VTRRTTYTRITLIVLVTGAVMAAVLARLSAGAVAEVTGGLASAVSRSGEVVGSGWVPEPVPPDFVPPEPRFLSRSGDESIWTHVLRPTVAYRTPDRDARVVARLSTTTSEGTSNVLIVLDWRKAENGQQWVRVRLPVLPNNTTGWVRRNALGGYGVVRTRLVVDVERLTATLYRRDHPIFEAPVGVGRKPWPTPEGNFYIRSKLIDFASPVYGPLAFGTSARSSVLTDWPAGGFIGIHGTNEPELLPGRVSHGCIRMRNEDILKLGRLMPVGTPLTIR